MVGYLVVVGRVRHPRAVAGPHNPEATSGRPPETSRGRWRRPGRFLRDLNLVALLTVIAASAGLLLLPRTDDGLLGLPELRLGDPSPRTINSPRSFAIDDPETTRRFQEDAMKRVRPTYDHQLWWGEDVRVRVLAAFEALGDGAEGDPADPTVWSQEFMLALRVTIEPDRLRLIQTAENREELRDAIIRVAADSYDSIIVADRPYLGLQAGTRGVSVRKIINRYDEVAAEDVLTDHEQVLGVDQAVARVDQLVAKNLAHLEPVQRRLVALVVKRLLRANLVPNDAETERRKIARRDSVKKVVIPIAAGAPVIRAGERVSQQHLLILARMRDDLKGQGRLQAIAGSALLVALLVIVVYRIARRSYQPEPPKHGDLAFLASSYVVMLLVLWGGYKGILYLAELDSARSQELYRLLVPVSAGALLVRRVAGVEASTVFGVVVGLSAGWMMDSSLGFAFYVMAGSLAAASSHDVRNPRSALFRALVRIGLAQTVAVFALELLGARFAVDLLVFEVGAALASAVLSVVTVALVLPVIELLFGFTTDHRLNELANINHPLLKELLVEAPATYNHSLLVGDLAEAGARAIGGHALLAQVGGYYHDIGKLDNPRAYSENTVEAFSSLSPKEEADVLRQHVDKGLELATRYRLGQPLSEIIAQHHGTQVVRSAFKRAQTQEEGVDAKAFAYAGPKPVTREAALVMLADIVETATRDLGAEPTLDRERIEQRVRQLMTEVLEGGQLDACKITLRDLGSVVGAFTSVLEDRLVRHGASMSGLPTSTLPASHVVPSPPGAH